MSQPAESEGSTGQRTPLYEEHLRLGARIIPFGGWDMPVQYSGIVKEHEAVRTKAGLFDISHMGEVRVEGEEAAAFLDFLVTGALSRLEPGRGAYTQMCRDDGGTVDDLYAYRLNAQTYVLVINASRIEADLEWIHAVEGRREWKVRVQDESRDWSAVALQGPASAAVLQAWLGESSPAIGLAKNQFLSTSFPGAVGEGLIARTGYTGEDGFECLVRPVGAVDLWCSLLEAGAEHGLIPCGLGARDTLRTEACYPLYGHELSESISPLEAGVGWSFSWDKGDFVGREILLRAKESGNHRRLVAFKMQGRSAPPRAEYQVFLPGAAEPVGYVTSGTQSPSLGIGVGLALVQPGQVKMGDLLEIEIRGRKFPAEVVKKPLVRPGQSLS